MKVFICFALFVAAASAGIVGPLGGPIALGGISPLGLGLTQQQLLVNSPLVSKVGLGPQLITSQLGLASPLGLGLGGTRIIGAGVPLNAGLGLGLGLGGLPLGSPLGLGGQIISPLNGGLILKK